MNLLSLIGAVGLSAVCGVKPLVEHTRTIVTPYTVRCDLYSDSNKGFLRYNFSTINNSTLNNYAVSIFHVSYTTYDNYESTFWHTSGADWDGTASFNAIVERILSYNDGFGIISFNQYSDNQYKSYRFYYSHGYNLYNDFLGNSLHYFIANYTGTATFTRFTFDYEGRNFGYWNPWFLNYLTSDEDVSSELYSDLLNGIFCPLDFNTDIRLYYEGIYGNGFTLYPYGVYVYGSSSASQINDYILVKNVYSSSDLSQVYHDGYDDGYDYGYTTGHDDGYDNGYNIGYDNGYDTGYANGKTDGIASANDYTFLGLFGAVADTPVIMIRSLFNFDFFGINLLTVVLSLFTGVILFYLLRKLL